MTVVWVAGYGAAQANVPAAIRQAMLQLVSHWFEFRGVILADKRMEVIPMSVDALLAPFRRVGL